MDADNPRAADALVPGEHTRSSSQCEPIQAMDDPMAVGALVTGEESAAAAVLAEMAGPPPEVLSAGTGRGKRRRGRPVKGHVKAPEKKMIKDEEDVCFICFDGGNLVLCDRRGCPKAYHPACIKRDESFFRSKAQWNCGWHICSSCEKAAYYMCYTCTYSLCKACVSVSEIKCVRGNKGFCSTCMRIVMLIENNAQGDKEMVQVDFDDKSSWEYLFKVYWIYLKGKLSLSLDELTKAKHPWKAASVLSCKGESSGELYDASNDKGSTSDGSSKNKLGNSSKRKMDKVPLFRSKDAQNVERAVVRTSLPEGSQWATNELLEFVAHMKDGETSILSQFDVQALLLEYIRRNNLRDPRRKSQVICDMRLRKLFGKARVGHFEMLKLLEFHFLIKEDSRVNCMQGGFAGVISSQADVDGNYDGEFKKSKDKRRKTRKQGHNRGPQTNLDEYAAIDVYNINLIYLRRGLMENLIDDAEKFPEKAVGAVVRIRIPGVDQKQDIYRLVQVVGTSKAAAPYKIGQRTADVMLEILNLDKKEVISIDTISNQEFSEDECIRLCQSIKCGVAKRLFVGEILEKAMALREVKLTDNLDSEILRLSHLRDRASEMGRKKELRECVQKLEILNTPEERRRRLNEIPEVHADPSMGLIAELDVNSKEPTKKKEDLFATSTVSSDNTCHPNKSLPATDYQHNEFISGTHGRASESPPVVTDKKLTSNPSAWKAPSACSYESEKIWHYLDPNGKSQGPFCMVQLRKWSDTGYFPPDLRVWRMSETQNDSILLTYALDGDIPAGFASEQPQLHGSLPAPTLLENPSEPLLQKRKESHEIKAPDSGQDHEDQNRHTSAVSLIQKDHNYERTSNGCNHPGQSSSQNWKPPLLDLPSPTPKQSDFDQKGPIDENKPSACPSFLGEVSVSDLLASDTSNWNAVLSGPTEFTTLGEESVSDLLAEVDAMEMNGLPSSPTSRSCTGEFPQDCPNSCFSPIDVFSPTFEPGKADALSSTGDLQLPLKSVMLDEAKTQVSLPDVLNAEKRSSG